MRTELTRGTRQSHHQVPPFLVTGAPRSGTTYTADVLANLGYWCRHERFFNPWKIPDRATYGQDGRADVSWLAVPFLDELPEGTLVVHQVRHPLRVISSFVGVRFFDFRFQRLTRWKYERAVKLWYSRRNADDPVRFTVAPHYGYMKRYCPEAFGERGEVAKAARQWLAWNERIERAERSPHLEYRRIRIEDMGPDLLRDLTARLGGPEPSPEQLDAALQSVPTDRNSKRKGPKLRWSDLPDHLRPPVQDLARDYGYES
jgi:hypothetical protein